MNTCGKGKHRVWLKKAKVGDDVVYLVGGGQRPHIGGMTVCEPGKRARNVKFAGHYDCVVTAPIAKAGARKNKRTAVCIGGVHVDAASAADIRQLVGNCKKLARFV